VGEFSTCSSDRPPDADWPQIWPFFSAIVAAGETYAYPEDLTSDQARALWLEMPPGQTFVAVDGDVVLGSAKTGPNRPRPRVPRVDGELHGRSGGARAEVRDAPWRKHVLAWATEQGYRSMQFNAVVETNVRARGPVAGTWASRSSATVPGAFDHRTLGLVRSARDVPRAVSATALIRSRAGPRPAPVGSARTTRVPALPRSVTAASEASSTVCPAGHHGSSLKGPGAARDGCRHPRPARAVRVSDGSDTVHAA